MSFFTRLFGRPDPTRDWPASTGPAPQVSVDRRRLESLAATLPFGADLDAARVLGRPDVCASAAEGVYTLSYAKWGMALEFEQGRFVQVEFVIAPDPDDATVAFEPAQVHGPDRERLSPTTTQEELVARFGPASRIQTFDEETILYYTGGTLVSEFQLEHGRLVRWHVYTD